MITFIGLSLIILSIFVNIYAAVTEYKTRKRRTRLNANDWAYIGD